MARAGLNYITSNVQGDGAAPANSFVIPLPHDGRCGVSDAHHGQPTSELHRRRRRLIRCSSQDCPQEESRSTSVVPCMVTNIAPVRATRLLSGPCSYLLAGADSAGSSALFPAVGVRLNQPGLHMTFLHTCNAVAAATAPVKASLLACRQDRGGRQCAACSAAAGCTRVADSSRFTLLDRRAGECCILPFVARRQFEACTACSHVRRRLLNASYL